MQNAQRNTVWQSPIFGTKSQGNGQQGQSDDQVHSPRRELGSALAESPKVAVPRLPDEKAEHA
eukprot:3472359-Pleurochrysis_carterae.AAC.3